MREAAKVSSAERDEEREVTFRRRVLSGAWENGRLFFLGVRGERLFGVRRENESVRLSSLSYISQLNLS